MLVVDTDQNILGDDPFDGLLLHHPKLSKQQAGESPATIEPARLEEMLKIRENARSEFVEHPAKANRWTAEILSGFSDPLNETELRNQHWIAAFAPIVVRGRPIDIADTGWGVIVAEREVDDPGIFGFQLKVLAD